MIATARLAIIIATVAAPPDVTIPFGDPSPIAKNLGLFAEPAVPILHNAVILGQMHVIDILERSPEELVHVPIVSSDIIANTYIRTTYLTAHPPGASLGTSIVASPSIRRPSSFELLPCVNQAVVTTGGPERIRTELSARFGSAAVVKSIRTFPTPVVGRTEVGLTIGFECHEEIALNLGLRGNDAFRLLTLSSMFADTRKYDANVLRFEDARGTVRTLRMSEMTPRGSHLFPAPVELGSWLELIKEPGSEWFPNSPSVRVDIRNRAAAPIRLGIQGFLDPSLNPNDDSLNVWIEWIDAPDVVPRGRNFSFDYQVTATPPASVH